MSKTRKVVQLCNKIEINKYLNSTNEARRKQHYERTRNKIDFKKSKNFKIRYQEDL